jgi:hypothetical protein
MLTYVSRVCEKIVGLVHGAVPTLSNSRCHGCSVVGAQQDPHKESHLSLEKPFASHPFIRRSFSLVELFQPFLFHRLQTS